MKSLGTWNVDACVIAANDDPDMFDLELDPDGLAAEELPAVGGSLSIVPVPYLDCLSN